MKLPIKVSNGSVSQTIDLKEVFGVSFKKSRSLQEQVTQKLIDKMKERVAAGVDRFGEEMAPYSEVYKESFDYIAARKDGTVNMKLTGDMLGSIDILESSGDKVTIGFVSSKENQKAYNHMMGEGNLPVRSFFGVTESEVEEVKSEFSQELDILSKVGGTELTVENRSAFGSLDELRSILRARESGQVVK